MLWLTSSQSWLHFNRFQITNLEKAIKVEYPEMQVQSLGREDPLEKRMANPSSIFSWDIPWTEKPGGLQPMGSPAHGVTKSWTGLSGYARVQRS